MYISSYNTYISTNSSQKTDKQSLKSHRSSQDLFVSKFSQDSILKSKNTKDTPINYISNYKAFTNKQKLQNDDKFQNDDKVRFSHVNTIKNATKAYGDNSKMFSLFIEPKATQSQVPHVKGNTKHLAINAYLENDKYHKITA